jgi:hypothetical protein
MLDPQEEDVSSQSRERRRKGSSKNAGKVPKVKIERHYIPMVDPDESPTLHDAERERDRAERERERLERDRERERERERERMVSTPVSALEEDDHSRDDHLDEEQDDDLGSVREEMDETIFEDQGPQQFAAEILGTSVAGMGVLRPQASVESDEHDEEVVRLRQRATKKLSKQDRAGSLTPRYPSSFHASGQQAPSQSQLTPSPSPLGAWHQSAANTSTGSLSSVASSSLGVPPSTKKRLSSPSIRKSFNDIFRNSLVSQSNSSPSLLATSPTRTLSAQSIPIRSPSPPGHPQPGLLSPNALGMTHYFHPPPPLPTPPAGPASMTGQSHYFQVLSPTGPASSSSNQVLGSSPTSSYTNLPVASPPQGSSYMLSSSVASSSYMSSAQALHHHPPAASDPYQVTVRETSEAVKDRDPTTGCKMINHYMLIGDLGRGVHGKVKLAQDVNTQMFYVSTSPLPFFFFFFFKAIPWTFSSFLLRLLKYKIEKQQAIKIVKKQKRKRFGHRNTGPEAGVAQIQREIAVLKKCEHPHVVRLYEVIDDPGIDSVFLGTWWTESFSWQVNSSEPNANLNAAQQFSSTWKVARFPGRTRLEIPSCLRACSGPFSGTPSWVLNIVSLSLFFLHFVIVLVC